MGKNQDPGSRIRNTAEKEQKLAGGGGGRGYQLHHMTARISASFTNHSILTDVDVAI
jgi:hypothetical protein